MTKRAREFFITIINCRVTFDQGFNSVLGNLVPRVLWLFGQRVGDNNSVLSVHSVRLVATNTQVFLSGL